MSERVRHAKEIPARLTLDQDAPAFRMECVAPLVLP